MSHLDPNLEAAVRRITAAEQLLTCWDFDGTLAPIVSDPEAARPLPGALELLLELAALPATSVALLSGRARSDLARLSGAPPPLLLVGSHGTEFPAEIAPAADPGAGGGSGPQVALAEVVAEVEFLAAGIDGVHLERKPVSIAVHVRNVNDREAAARLSHQVEHGPGSRTGVHVTTGKEVVELSVRHGDKGQAITVLRSHTSATAVTFIGDDVTDERGFAALGEGDLGVKVGGGQTRAAFRVQSPDEAIDFLRLLVSGRASSTAR